MAVECVLKEILSVLSSLLDVFDDFTPVTLVNVRIGLIVRFYKSLMIQLGIIRLWFENSKVEILKELDWFWCVE